jgi:hypothetical protein
MNRGRSYHQEKSFLPRSSVGRIRRTKKRSLGRARHAIFASWCKSACLFAVTTIMSRPPPEDIIFKVSQRKSSFLVLFHSGAGDKVGAPLNSYSRFGNRQEAEAQCSVQMGERSIEQKCAGVYLSVSTEAEYLLRSFA